MNDSPHLTIVIPCHNDAVSLARLLPRISTSQLAEIIVVCSPGGGDAVKHVCGEFGAQCVVIDEPRGARLSAGAKLARAPNLWFLHADAVVEDTAVEAVIRAFNDGWIGGYFRFQLLGPNTLGKRWIEFTVGLRCRFGGIPYGDQAPFVTAADYARAGGHEPVRLFDEFRLIRRLMRDDRFHLLPKAVGVDTRRWKEGSFMMNILQNRFFSLAYSLGVSPDRLARWYYKS